MVRLAFCGIPVLAGCTKPLTAELRLRSLKANNLEETISRKDEVMIAYSLTAFDSKNQMVGVVNNAWGVQTMTKGMSTTLASQAPVQLEIPKGGKVVASLVLIEVDNYAEAQSLVGRIQQVNKWVQVPAGFLALGVEALTPLKYVTLGLTAAGLGVQLADRLDDDDLLGQSSVELKDTELQKSPQKLLRIPARFTGENLRDSFDYQLEYDVQLKRMRFMAKK
ncbi:hypothetical protein [Tellurirhabdus rosea]|uniref:hypothetical protein n=1 Tax=Tellurirhabdus rosea TaxID=2674997 RepID=UPI00225677AB|nr:hypothetical protein [Tellurirhabdus rosea]